MSSQSEQVEIYSCSLDGSRSCHSNSNKSNNKSHRSVSRRVSFQLDKNGEVVAHVLGEANNNTGSECRDTQFTTTLIQASNGFAGIRLTSYKNPMHSRGASSMDSSRFLALRDQFEKLTKSDEISRGSGTWRLHQSLNNNNHLHCNTNNAPPTTTPTASRFNKQADDLARAGVYDSEGTFQPWFFGKITRRESEMLLSDTVSGSFLVRFSEKSTCCFTLSVHTNYNNNNNAAAGGGGASAVLNTGSTGVTANGGGGGGGPFINFDLNKNHFRSHSSAQHNNIRHFLILPDQTEFKLLGSAATFTTLSSLIHHHGYSPITKSGNELLLHVCPKPLDFSVSLHQ